jgi:hypothetical protein
VLSSLIFVVRERRSKKWLLSLIPPLYGLPIYFLLMRQRTERRSETDDRRTDDMPRRTRWTMVLLPCIAFVIAFAVFEKSGYLWGAWYPGMLIIAVLGMYAISFRESHCFIQSSLARYVSRVFARGMPMAAMGLVYGALSSAFFLLASEETTEAHYIVSIMLIPLAVMQAACIGVALLALHGAIVAVVRIIHARW